MEKSLYDDAAEVEKIFTDAENVYNELSELPYCGEVKFYYDLLGALGISLKARKNPLQFTNVDFKTRLADKLTAVGIENPSVAIANAEFGNGSEYEVWTVGCLDDIQKLVTSAKKIAANSKLERQKSSELDDAITKLQEFKLDSKAAIESLKNLENFGNATIFSEEILTAAAHAKLYDRKTFSELTHAIKTYGASHPEKKVSIVDWKNIVAERAEDIQSQYSELLAIVNEVRAKFQSEKFFADNPDLHFKMPKGYSMSMQGGVVKLEGEKELQVCLRPVIIAAKTKNVYAKSKKFQWILKTWKANGTPRILPEVPPSTILNRFRILDLANDGLSVCSGDANSLCAYINAFNAINEDNIPMTCTVPRCGWHFLDGKNVFVDPRRVNTYEDKEEGGIYPLVADADSQFAQALVTEGTLDEWRKAYELAKSSTVARFTVAACLAAPLLNPLNERNFLFYTKGRSRGGKSTALLLGASAVGSNEVVRSLDSTRNGLIGAAADAGDYSLLLDEKQSADERLQQAFSLVTYSLANGKGRSKLDSESRSRKVPMWKTVIVLNGETELIQESATEGEYTRVLTVNAPDVILPTNACKEIRRIINHNYGHVLPLFVDKIFECGFKNLSSLHTSIDAELKKKSKDTPEEYRNYASILTLADTVLNICLGVDKKLAFKDSLSAAVELLKLTPTISDIDVVQREVDAINDFIVQNQPNFIRNGGAQQVDRMTRIFGKIRDDCVFITVSALRLACRESQLNYFKVRADLVKANAFAMNDEDGKPQPLHLTSLLGRKSRCYKFVCYTSSSDETDAE